MKRVEMRNNFIIYLLLVVFLITGAGFGLGDNGRVFSLCQESNESRITIPVFTASDEIHVFQVRERSTAVLRYVGLKNGRSDVSLKNNIVFLCVLAILSVYFRLIQERFVYYGRLYVRERFYVIAYIQAIDGRKRMA